MDKTNQKDAHKKNFNLHVQRPLKIVRESTPQTNYEQYTFSNLTLTCIYTSNLDESEDNQSADFTTSSCRIFPFIGTEYVFLSSYESNYDSSSWNVCLFFNKFDIKQYHKHNTKV